MRRKKSSLPTGRVSLLPQPLPFLPITKTQAILINEGRRNLVGQRGGRHSTGFMRHPSMEQQRLGDREEAWCITQCLWCGSTQCLWIVPRSMPGVIVRVPGIEADMR